MHDFLAGTCAMGLLVATLWFLQAWSASRDRLFLLFAISFLLMAGIHIYQAITDTYRESGSLQYIVRLASYLLIIVAIVDKNRVGRVAPTPPVRPDATRVGTPP
jgi:hypothetical protein